MAKLSDFATLADARAYTETTLKPIDQRMVNERGIFALIRMGPGEALMSAIEDDATMLNAGLPLIPQRVKNWFKPSEQGVDIADPDALDILGAMTQLGIITPEQLDTLAGYAYNVSRPFENATQAEFDFNQPEEMALPSNTAQHVIEFGIANSAPSIVSVNVMQRFGSANDLTPWHVCGSTRVQYKQSRYKIMIPASQGAVRELKLVTDYQLGLTS